MIAVFNKSHGSLLVVKYCFSFPELLNPLRTAAEMLRQGLQLPASRLFNLDKEKGPCRGT